MVIEFFFVTSVAYRSWAAKRLRQSSDWIDDWSTNDMFAGIAGMSAEEAWYATAIQLERAKLLGQPVTGASLDIHKCFDQLVREHVHHVLEEVGCLEPLLVAHKSCLNTWLFIILSMGT